MTLLSYEQSIELPDGVIDRCYRLKQVSSSLARFLKCRGVTQEIEIYDLRYTSEGEFIGLSEEQLTRAACNFSDAQGLLVGKVWIDDTDAWSADFIPHPKDGENAGSLPINECLRLLKYKAA